MTSTTITRRTALQGALLGAATTLYGIPAFAQSKTVKVGIVAPQTGPLALFYEGFPFVMEAFTKALGTTVDVGGQKHTIEFVLKDSQSSPNRAAEVTQELILNDSVDIVLAFATPATVNPVADQCELNGIPCLTADCPLESYFFGRGGDPHKGFNWTYHFSFSGADMVTSWTSMWSKIDTNKSVGLLFANDPDGINMSSALKGAVGQFGMTANDPGRFDLPAGNYAAQIAAFKAAKVEIVGGALTPPDFGAFWSAAAQQGFRPKVVTVGKALEFPAAIAGLDDRVVGLSVGGWWSPSRPFTSGFTNQSARALADAYEAASGRQWMMTLGDRHAILEALVDVLKRAADTSPESIRDALKETNYASIAGPINFKNGPLPNVSATPQTTFQWVKGQKHPYELKVVDNSRAPMVPLELDPFAIGAS